MNWQNLLLVLLGSGLGGSLRYLVAHFHGQISGDATKHFVPIIIVNLVGSFLIGLAFALLVKEQMNERTSLFLITGFMGGFTTYSSFSLDILRMIQRGDVLPAILYIFSSLLFGFAFVALGYWVGKLV